MRRSPQNFNPRSPCGERLAVGTKQDPPGLISIHAPRVGSDASAFAGTTTTARFQSTLPVWGATCAAGQSLDHKGDFNPRSPCGERRTFANGALTPTEFQSTLPVWGATAEPRPWVLGIRDFNPRSPCGERPQAQGAETRRAENFNPRSPCGERRSLLPLSVLLGGISIHAPRVGSD